MKSSVGVFLVALNIALGIVVISWLHAPPFDYQGKQSEAHPQAPIGQNGVPGSVATNAVTHKQGAQGHQQKDWKNYFLDHLPDWFVAAFTGLLVYVTLLLVKSTNRLWEAGERQIKVAERSAEASKTAAEVANQNLIASQRAWIKGGRMYISTGVIFDANGALNTSVMFEMSNVGNAPALHVKFRAQIFPMLDGKIPILAAKAFFDEVKNRPVSGGFILYPRNTYPGPSDSPVHHGIGLSKQEIEAATDEHGRMSSLYVAGCINYSFPSDLTKWHQTAALMQIKRVDGHFLVAGERLAVKQVVLEHQTYFGGMDFAD